MIATFEWVNDISSTVLCQENVASFYEDVYYDYHKKSKYLLKLSCAAFISLNSSSNRKVCNAC